MQTLDYLHAICVLGVAVYLWRREPPRILLAPLMLMSFVVLYGIGNIIYFTGADTVPDIRASVTASLILMWLGLIAGMELARAARPSATRNAATLADGWKNIAIKDDGRADSLLLFFGIAVTLYMLAVFVYFRKPSQILAYAALDTTSDKAKFRHDFGPEGGYLYQTLVASVSGFLSFLMLVKGAVLGRRAFLIVGAALAALTFAGKVGSFEKAPWLIYLMQLLVLFQVSRSLKFSIGRLIILLCVLLGGMIAAIAIALPQLEAGAIVEWLGYRFFEVNNEVLYQTYYVYPDYIPHTWGLNIGLLHSVFGSGELVSAHTKVANFFDAPEATFDSFFVGDAWVDFSFAGVLILSLIVGFIVKTIDIAVLSLGKTPLCLALLGSGMYGLFQLQVTSAFTAFLSGGLILIPLLAFATVALGNDMLHVTRNGRLERASWQK